MQVGFGRTRIRTRLKRGPNLVAALMVLVLLPAAAAARGGGAVPAPSRFRPRPEPGAHRFRLLGHSPLRSRGMNAALAIHPNGRFAYVGDRTDGPRPNGGVLVVKVADPRDPKVVRQIDTPDANNPGETSRELRIWPEKGLLMVLNFACSPIIHGCSPISETVDPTIRFFDIRGDNARSPELVSTYEPSRMPHEIFLWDDPKRPGRALLYMTTPSTSRDNLLVTNISHARQGQFPEIESFNVDIVSEDDNRLHSLSVSVNGRRGYLAYLGGGFLVVDTSELAEARNHPDVHLVTPVQNRPHWGDPGAHSAVPFFGRHFALVTDEVYGKFGGVLAAHGCPWGWVRLINIENPRRPEVVGHYKLFPYNHRSYCDEVPEDRENFSSWGSHNPTLTRRLAFISWHSAGLQVVNIRHPRRAWRAGEFIPPPLGPVDKEDPALSAGRDKVVMWSYPIIKDGLVYVVDIRNGLYILKYRGRGRLRDEVANIDFLEGNSNLGDARRFAP
jgi:hypothetical protein